MTSRADRRTATLALRRRAAQIAGRPPPVSGVMAGLDPAICRDRVPAWMAGSSPAMTWEAAVRRLTVHARWFPPGGSRSVTLAR